MNYLMFLLTPWSGSWLVPLLAMVLSVAAMVHGWGHIDGDLIYPEFVSGPDAISDAGKARDLVALKLFFVATGVFYLWLNGLAKLASSRGKIPDPVLRRLLAYSFIPLLPWLGMATVVDDLWPPYAWYIGIGAGLWIMGLAVIRPNATVWSMPRIAEQFAAIVIFSLFTGFALIVATTYVWPESPLARLWMRPLSIAPLLVVLLLMGIVWLAQSGLATSYIRKSLVVVQMPLPLLGIVLLPAHVIYRGDFIHTAVTFSLVVLTVGLIVLGVWHIGRLLREANSSDRQLVSPWSVIFIGIFVAAGLAMYPSPGSDAFHFGEQILPWHQVAWFGKVPFVEVIPFHGWMHILSGLLNQLFYDGTIAGYRTTQMLMFGLASALVSFAAFRLAGPRVALLIALLYLPQSFYAGRLLFVAPAFLLLALPSLTARPLAWLWSWISVTLFLGFYNTVSGASFAIVTLPFALWMLVAAGKREPRRLGLSIFALIILLSALAAIPLVRSAVAGYVVFILENRPGYEAIQGRAWAESFSAPGFASGILSIPAVYEIVRNGWILCVPALVFFFLRRLGESERPSFDFSLLTIGLAGWLVMMSSYALGRIDPAVAGRGGTLTYLVLFTFMPVIIYRYFPAYRNVFLPALWVLAGVYCAMMSAHDRLTWQGLLWRSNRVVEVPADLVAFDGNKEGSPGVGLVFLSEERAASMRAFRAALDQVVPPGEPYWDFSNYQTFYAFAHRQVPDGQSAVANLDNHVKQQRALAAIDANPPPAILISPKMDYDFEMNIRSFELFRYAVLHYRPVREDGYIFMVNEQSPAFARGVSGSAAIEMLLDVYRDRDLKFLAAGWGRSWDTLQSKAVFRQALDVAADEGATVRYALTPDASQSDLLVLSFDVDQETARDDIRITWRNATPERLTEPVILRSAASTLVIPMGSFPDWILAEALQELTVSIPSGMRIKRAELWARTVD